MDAALRDEDALQRRSAADASRAEEQPLTGDDPLGSGHIIPNTPPADEEVASEEAFEAGVDAAEDEARSAGQRTPSDQMGR